VSACVPLTARHALFPPTCGAFLLGLFLLFKFLPKDLINAVLTGYFVLLVRSRACTA
jgi:minor histocompatibility antigen H13